MIRLWDTDSIKDVLCRANTLSAVPTLTLVIALLVWQIEGQDCRSSIPSRASEEDGQHPKCSGGCLMSSATVCCLGMEMEAGRVSCWLEKEKCCPHLQNGQESTWGSTGQMSSLWNLYGAGSLGRYLWACEVEGIRMLNQPDYFLWWDKRIYGWWESCYLPQL